MFHISNIHIQSSFSFQNATTNLLLKVKFVPRGLWHSSWVQVVSLRTLDDLPNEERTNIIRAALLSGLKVMPNSIQKYGWGFFSTLFDWDLSSHLYSFIISHKQANMNTYTNTYISKYLYLHTHSIFSNWFEISNNLLTYNRNYDIALPMQTITTTNAKKPFNTTHEL